MSVFLLASVTIHTLFKFSVEVAKRQKYPESCRRLSSPNLIMSFLNFSLYSDESDNFTKSKLFSWEIKSRLGVHVL